MISFANAKINIGLNIVGKRADGYHLLESVFYPFPLYDIIEITSKESTARTTLEITGLHLPTEDNNLCLRARSEEHTSELQSRENLVCRLLLEKKKPGET